MPNSALATCAREPMLQLKNVDIGFSGRQQTSWAVSGMDLCLYPQETLALLGESGCGKSLTASAIMQLLPLNAVVNEQASILYEDRDCLDLPEKQLRQLRGRDMAMIFQEPMTALNPVLTISQQIQEVLRAHGMTNKSSKIRRTEELLVAVGIPQPKRIMQEYPHQLSGGMKQRIVIAMALAGEPKLLIADEPTTALDTTIQAQILQLIASLKKQFNMSILFITHDLGVVRHFADRIAVMYAGHIVEQAPVDDFFAAPQHPYSQQLLKALPSLQKRETQLAVIPGFVPKLGDITTACRFAPRCHWAWARCESQAPSIIETATLQSVRCHLYDDEVLDKPLQAHAVTESQGATAESFTECKQQNFSLTVNDIKVYYPIYKGLFKRHVGDVKAVDGVSIQLSPGKTTAIVGESGCGKTTLGKSLVQLVALTAGDIQLDGQSILSTKGADQYHWHETIQMIFQDPFSSMNPRLRVEEIITEGMTVLQPHLSRQQRHERCKTLLNQVELPEDSLQRYPHQFSGGQRQRIAIARALAVSPRIIVCDEPTSALDVSVQAKLLNLLRQLQRQHQLAYCFITHDIAVLGFMADEVCVMYLGRLVERGTVEEILHDAKHPYTQALLAAVPKVEQNGQHEFTMISGDLPSPAAPPQGCHFHPRCPYAMPKCKLDYPEVVAVSKTQSVNCFLFEEKA